MNIRGFLKTCIFAALLPAAALAEEANLRPFEPQGPIHRISVTSTASTAEQVTPTSSTWNGCVQYRLENVGATDLYVGFGATASAAETNAADAPAAGDTGVAYLVRAGAKEVVSNIPKAYVSAKTASGTSTLDVGCGQGHLVASGGAVTVSSGTSTSNQGTPTTSVNAWPVKVTDGTDIALVTAAGEQNVLASAQPGVDIGDVTINNGAGAAAVNVQDGGNSLTVDGTVTATPSGTQDTNLTQLAGTALATPFDADTGVGTQNLAGVSLRKSASGGSVELGTSTDPVRTDPTGTTTQPVSGTVTATGPLTDAQLRATAVPVSGTVTANAGTGPFPVSDNAGSLTVDAPVATPVNVQIGDAVETATVRDTGTSDSLNVAIVDAAGAQITSFGGGTGSGVFAEDTAHVTGDNGVQQLGVRNDTAAALTSLDGDYSPIAVTSRGGTIVEGPVAHDLPAGGNPVLIAGIGNSASPSSVSIGDTVRAWHTVTGGYVINPDGAASTPADGTSNASRIQLDHSRVEVGPYKVFPYVFNGTTWDRQRGNTTGSFLGAPTTGGDPCGATGVVKSSVAVSTTADAELVAISGTTVVYVCGFSINAGGGTAPGFRFITGTGTTCATGTVGETGIYLPGLNDTVDFGGAGQSTFQGAAGAALCIDVSGTTPDFRGIVTFVQQ